ncbi:MAG: UbiA prenyltransferase family protein [Myxococcota bacterium]
MAKLGQLSHLHAVLSGVLRTMRPHQWVKNLFVLLPLVFSRELLNFDKAGRVLMAFLLFCLASSAVYIFNDIQDVESDRAHPIKRNRPIPSGLVSLPVARAAVALLSFIVLSASLILGPFFFASVSGYLLLNLAYSLRLKRIAYLDVLSIAAGFELRVLGGAFAAPVVPSVYLALVTFALALFLGFGKRRHELAQGSGAAKRRSVLQAYDMGVVDALLFVTSMGTVLLYATYALDSDTRDTFGTDYLVATTVFTLFGVLRFHHLVRSRPQAESPTEEMLKDPPFLANLALWGTSIVLLLYLGVGHS